MSSTTSQAKYARVNRAVYARLRTGQWWTLTDLCRSVGDELGLSVTTASMSARVRDLRKDAWGKHRVERLRLSTGVNLYTIIPRGRVPRPLHAHTPAARQAQEDAKA